MADEQVEAEEEQAEEELGFDEGTQQLESVHSFSIEKNDRSLSELKNWNDEKDLIIDPAWQRRYVWNNARASRLIESFLLDLPVPVIYFAKTADERYEVIDGLQRLTSVFKFFADEYRLTGLEFRHE